MAQKFEGPIDISHVAAIVKSAYDAFYRERRLDRVVQHRIWTPGEILSRLNYLPESDADINGLFKAYEELLEDYKKRTTFNANSANFGADISAWERGDEGTDSWASRTIVLDSSLIDAINRGAIQPPAIKTFLVHTLYEDEAEYVAAFRDFLEHVLPIQQEDLRRKYGWGLR